MSLKRNGIKRLNRAMVKSSPVVRFYLRDAYGRFTSNKVVFMPLSVYRYPCEFLSGKMITLNHRGYIFKVHADNPVKFNSINWQTFKAVK